MQSIQFGGQSIQFGGVSAIIEEDDIISDFDASERFCYLHESWVLWGEHPTCGHGALRSFPFLNGQFSSFTDIYISRYTYRCAVLLYDGSRVGETRDLKAMQGNYVSSATMRTRFRRKVETPAKKRA